VADPTFYRSAQTAAAAPPERLAYVATLNTPGPDGEAPTAGPLNGGLAADPDFFVQFEGERQVRLEGGDASSDSYCYSSS
jgi:hypothetical protein